MRQTKVLNAEPMVKVGEVKTSQGTVPALIACYRDLDTDELFEFPMLPPIAKAHQELVREAMKDLPDMSDLVIPEGPISEKDLQRLVELGQPPPRS